MSNVDILNLRQRDIPIDAEACNKLIREIKWDMVKQEDEQAVYPLESVEVDIGSARTRMTLSSSVVAVPTPKRTKFDYDSYSVIDDPPDEPMAIGLSDKDGVIKVSADEIQRTTTIGARVSVRLMRRNRTNSWGNGDGEALNVTGQGLAFQRASVHAPYHERSSGNAGPDMINPCLTDIGRMIGRDYHSGRNSADTVSIPIYAGILTSDTLSDATHCGGAVTRIGGTYDKPMQDCKYTSLYEALRSHYIALRNREGTPDCISSPCNAAYGWRLAEMRPDLVANIGYGGRAMNYDRISKRYFDALISRADDAKDYVAKAFNSQARAPVSHLIVHIDYYLTTPQTGKGKIVELPADTKLTMMVDSGPISDILLNVVADKVNSYWGQILRSMVPTLVADLSPANLFTQLDGQEDKFELMASPFVKAMVRDVYGGWCYESPADADAAFKANPPVNLRGLEVVGSRMLRKFEAAKAKITTLLSTAK